MGLSQVQGNRAIRPVRCPARERELLPFRPAGEVQAHLGLENRVGPALEFERMLDVARAGIGACDVPDHEQGFASVRTHRALPQPKGAEVHVERQLVVSHRTMDVADVGQDAGKSRMIGPEDPLANGQRAAV